MNKMNKLKLLALTALIPLLASCSYQIYPTSDMTFHYNARMNTEEELDAKAKVKIFLNESDIKGDYEVVAYLSYKPFTIPVIMNKKNKTIRRFYEKAVLKANELGANGIIITGGGVAGGGFCKLINLTDWDAEAEQGAAFVNPILDRKLLDKFLSGEVASKGKAERKRTEDMFKSEIKGNLRYAKTLEEADIIKEKINAYEKYNASLERPKSSITKDVKKFRSAHKAIVKKINRNLKKAAKENSK